jgi:ankyrin repeat protein
MNLLEFPVEIILEILAFLDFRDLFRLARVSVFLQQLCSDQAIWRVLYQRDLSAIQVPPQENYRDAYLLFQLRRKYVKYQSYPLMLAAKFNYEKAFTTLLPITSPSLVLPAAARGGYIEVVERIVSRGADRIVYSMEQAARGGHLKIVQLLLDRINGINGDATLYNCALGKAAKSGNTQIIQLLLNRGADAYGYALTKAAKKGHLEIVQMMLQYNVTNYDGAMEAAASGGHMAIIQLMQPYGTTDYPRVLIAAARGGHLNVIQYLIESDVSMGTNDLNEAMKYAARYGHLSSVQYLVKSGANNFDVAIHYAKSWGYYEVAEYLKHYQQENTKAPTKSDD